MADIKVKVLDLEAAHLWVAVDSEGTGPGNPFSELGVRLARQYDSVEPPRDILNSVDTTPEDLFEEKIREAVQAVVDRAAGAKGPDGGIEITLSDGDIALLRGIL